MAAYEETSMAAVFLNQVEKYGERGCVACKDGGNYSDISWNRMGEMLVNLSSFLLSMGMGKGDNIAIFSPNRYEWWVSDLAVLSIGSTVVSIYDTDSTEEVAYILDHSEARACFVGGQEHLEKVLQVKDKLSNLEFIIVYDQLRQLNGKALTFVQVLEKGQAEKVGDDFDNRLRSINPFDPAAIIYTSGTTAVPKGVMLSHNNFISNTRQLLVDFQGILSENDVFLSFLPLSHALERSAGYYFPILLGSKVAFAEDFSRLLQNLVEVRPTVIISVPRLFEKIHAGFLTKVSAASPVKKALVKWAVRAASENLPYICRQTRRTGWFALKYRLADKLVFSKLKKALGLDRLTFAVSGGGPLSLSDTEFFLGIEVAVLEGYGLTETSPVTNVNRLRLIKPGTVGPPLKDTLIRFSVEGEVLIKGPQVMLGYYKDEAATRESFTEDGFLRTGDIGVSDEDGYLSITGRIKDIIITAGGKNISPRKLEDDLKGSRFIEQVCIIGERRKYLSSLVVPAFEELKLWAQKKGVVFRDNKELIQDAAVLGLYEKEIEKISDRFARVEKIKKFKLLAVGWSQQTHELTPTLKIKRSVIEEKYRGLINEMY